MNSHREFNKKTDEALSRVCKTCKFQNRDHYYMMQSRYYLGVELYGVYDHPEIEGHELNLTQDKNEFHEHCEGYN